jgi:hypothetical protein
MSEPIFSFAPYLFFLLFITKLAATSNQTQQTNYRPMQQHLKMTFGEIFENENYKKYFVALALWSSLPSQE